MRISSVVLCLLMAVPTFAGSASANDWDRLGRLSKTEEVKVYLQGGPAIQGTIQQFGADGLGLVEQEKLTKVTFKQIESTAQLKDGAEFRRIDGYTRFQKGETVELKMRDGRVLQGAVQDVNLNYELLWLAETGAAAQLRREDIVRVMLKRRGHRGRNAAIGTAGGAAILWGIARLKSGPECFGPSAVRCYGTPPATFGVLGAILGAVAGAVVPSGGWTEVYRAP
jgi:hypothetical protein